MQEHNFKQELTGCFGQPIAENPSQAMVEAAYRHHDLDWRYLTIEVGPAGLADAVRGARAMGFRGFNCTIPHKVAVIEHLDGLAESASVIQAVNCVVRDGDRLIGENTDGKGFLSSLGRIESPAGKRVVVFGAGGAARAICVELALAGAARVTIVNRTVAKAEVIAKTIRENTAADAVATEWQGDYRLPPETDIVVNSTSIGLFPDVDARLAIDFDTLTPSMVVADVIINPPRTHLINTAEQRGCRVIDGLGMLVEQGVVGIQLWSGVEADPGVMRRELEAIFG